MKAARSRRELTYNCGAIGRDSPAGGHLARDRPDLGACTLRIDGQGFDVPYAAISMVGGHRCADNRGLCLQDLAAAAVPLEVVGPPGVLQYPARLAASGVRLRSARSVLQAEGLLMGLPSTSASLAPHVS